MGGASAFERQQPASLTSRRPDPSAVGLRSSVSLTALAGLLSGGNPSSAIVPMSVTATNDHDHPHIRCGVGLRNRVKPGMRRFLE